MIIRGLLLLLLIMARNTYAEPSAERQAALRELVQQDCGACHGLTRKGGIGPSLLPDALTAKTDDYLITTILNGRPGTAMPPWRSFISQVEAEWLVDNLLRK
ncbi:c-type cytochrome [Methylocucumis oryzae]|uniref:Cytochrome C55X NirC n=1 Tax=Methylocucumis oryzae TaxID=1632867 RepID=A0A0F3IIZ2_9GAMM|nr:cytochrome c [Methylocucumis oryzae]KJV06730.1 cytochrome C55X precursor NirC [Methylocucumis oryzae]